jgi:hypothetical protein
VRYLYLWDKGEVEALKSTTTLFVCLASVFSVDAWFAPNHLYSHQEEELCRVWNFLNFLSSTPVDLGGGGERDYFVRRLCIFYNLYYVVDTASVQFQ